MVVNPKFNKSKKEKEMKKIFYILTAAVVALGAMACENEGLENVGPNTDNTVVIGDGLAITANVSRVDWSGGLTTPAWEAGDSFEINGFEFVHQGDANNTFLCTTEGVRDNFEYGTYDITFGTLNSSAGLEGTVFTAKGVEVKEENTVANFAPANALLKVTTDGDITLKGAGMFSTGDTFEISGAVTDKYIAINPVGTAKLFAYSHGANVKAKTLAFEAQGIYNLGTINVLKESVWKITGIQNAWSESGNIKMYEHDGFAVAYNVKATNNGFKFVKGAWSTAVGAWDTTAFDFDDTSGSCWYGGRVGNESQNIVNKDFVSGTTYDIFLNLSDNKTYIVLPSSYNSAPNRLSLIGVVNESNWDTDIDFEKEGTKYVLKNVNITGEFKIRREHMWKDSWGYSNISTKTGVQNASGNFKVASAGLYDIELTVGTNNGYIYPTAIKATKK